MCLLIDIKFAAIKVYFLQNKGPKFEPVGNFTLPLPFVNCFANLLPCSSKFKGFRKLSSGKFTDFVQNSRIACLNKGLETLFLLFDTLSLQNPSL